MALHGGHSKKFRSLPMALYGGHRLKNSYFLYFWVKMAENWHAYVKNVGEFKYENQILLKPKSKMAEG